MLARGMIAIVVFLLVTTGVHALPFHEEPPKHGEHAFNLLYEDHGDQSHLYHDARIGRFISNGIRSVTRKTSRAALAAVKGAGSGIKEVTRQTGKAVKKVVKNGATKVAKLVRSGGSGSRKSTASPQETSKRHALKRAPDGTNSLSKPSEQKPRASPRSEAQSSRTLTSVARSQRGSVSLAGGRPTSNRWPKNGTWSGAPGNSVWTPNDEARRALLGGRGIQYQDGFPNFRPFGKAEVKIETRGGGNRDRRAADAALAQKMGWKTPKGKADLRRVLEFSKDHRWHHHYDNRTMVLLHKKIHALPHDGPLAVDKVYGIIKK